jgi:hypothetical protein
MRRSLSATLPLTAIARQRATARPLHSMRLGTPDLDRVRRRGALLHSPATSSAAAG